MQSHLTRRGGIWWTRLVVPVKLRELVGKREFTQSCQTHELAIAKLVANVLLSGWRQRLLGLEQHAMPVDVLKLIDRSPVLAAGKWQTLSNATQRTGLSEDHLLRSVEQGALKLYSRLFNCPGYIVELDRLDTVGGGYEAVTTVIPQSAQMPTHASRADMTMMLPVSDPRNAATTMLAYGKRATPIISFDIPDRPGFIFVPDTVMEVGRDRFEISALELEGLCLRYSLEFSPEAIERAREHRRAALVVQQQSAGTKGHRQFSVALEAYARSSSGIPGSVTSPTEQKQKYRGCALFVELIGDLTLADVVADRLREFREKLKQLPANPNHVPMQYQRESMTATMLALKDAGLDWPTMTEKAQRERLLWVSQMFNWLITQAWVKENPVVLVLNERTETAAERKVRRQTKAAQAELDDSDSREPFSLAEMGQIFSLPHYKTGNGTHVSGNTKWYPFEYWLPLIGLYAGCRIGEICQLWLDDIRMSSDGVWYFDINEVTPDKSLKNPNATRQVPVSPVLIELGLIEYRDALLAAGYQRLFPELTCSKSDARYAKEAKRKMSALLGSLGMPRDSTRVFHCLRANFNNAVTQVPLADLLFDDPDRKTFIRFKIMGHQLQGVNEKHYMSSTMSEALAMVVGVQYLLPAVCKFDIDNALAAVRAGLLNKRKSRSGREDMGPLNPA
jgi:integrase